MVVFALRAPNARAADAAPVSVALDRATAATRVGRHFEFTSTIRAGDRPLRQPVAHLNVLSLDRNVYVDPEDWSSHRTVYLATLAPHRSTTVRWTVQAVNEGHFMLYVAVGTERQSDRLAVSAALRAQVTARRTINAGGVLPVAVTVPLVMAALLVATRTRLRRRR